MYGVIKNNPSGNFLTIYRIQTQYILLLGEQVLTIFLCIKRVRLNWNLIVNDIQSATYSSTGPRDLFPWLNTRVKVHISLWTIREYPKRHFRYLSDSGDTFLPLIRFSYILVWILLSDTCFGFIGKSLNLVTWSSLVTRQWVSVVSDGCRVSLYMVMLQNGMSFNMI